MSHTALAARHRARGARLPLSLAALFLPGALFGLGVLLVRDHPRFVWLSSVALFPWELWVLLTSGVVATTAGVLDWRYHRSGKTVGGAAEHRSELLALAGGGVPLFVLMAAASVVAAPARPAPAHPPRRAVHGGGDLLRRVRLPPQALRRLRDAPAPAAGVRQRFGVAGLGSLVLRARGARCLRQRGPGICCGGPGKCTTTRAAPSVQPLSPPGGARLPLADAGCSWRWRTCATNRCRRPCPA